MQAGVVGRGYWMRQARCCITVDNPSIRSRYSSAFLLESVWEELRRKLGTDLVEEEDCTELPEKPPREPEVIMIDSYFEFVHAIIRSVGLPY